MKFSYEERLALFLLYLTDIEVAKVRDRNLLLNMDEFLFDNENMAKHLESLRSKGMVEGNRLSNNAIASARALTIFREYPDSMSESYFIYHYRQMTEEMVKRCYDKEFLTRNAKNLNYVIDLINQIIKNNTDEEE